MKYWILCEGAESGSEYKFIDAVVDTFRGNKLYEFESASGNKNIESKFSEMSSKFSHDDVFILFFDYVDEIGGKYTYDILKGMQDVCNDMFVRFRYSSYYCFEEVFLSYAGLDSIVKATKGVNKAILSEILKRIREDILSGEEYFIKPYMMYLDDIFKRSNNGLSLDNSNREGISAWLINYITRYTYGSFHISKNIMGECWVNDCSKINQGNLACNKCTYCMRDKTFIEKLDDLDSRSIAVKGLQFSTIFQ